MTSLTKYIKDIDDTPLDFGKFKGETPNALFKNGEYSYICWLAENIDPPVVSDDLHEGASCELETQSELSAMAFGADQWW